MSRWLQLINGWFRPRLEPEENAFELFERLWNDQESGRRINFMSIAFNTSSDSMSKLKDIGLSHWSKQGLHQQVAHHWRIGKKVEPKDVVEFGNPDSFNFGTTQTIAADDIRTVFDDWVSYLSDSCDKLCVVMYGEQSIQTLAKHWRSPAPVLVLDLEAAWHQRHQKVEHFTFEQVASATEDLANATSTLDNAGNQAYCLLVLLKSLAKKNKDPSADWEYSYE